MPNFSDYDSNDDDDRSDDAGSTIGSSPGANVAPSSTGAPAQQQASKQQERPYIPWSSFQSANSDVSNREASKLQDQTQNDVNSTQSQLSGLQAADTASIDSNYTKKTNATPKGIDPSTTTAQVLPDTTLSLPSKAAPANGLSSDTIQNTGAAPWAGPRDHHPPHPNGGQPDDGSATGGSPLVDTNGTTALQGNPWSGFLKPPPTGPQVQGQLNPTVAAQPSQQTANLKDIASRGDLNANADPSKTPKDLEASAGPDAWAALQAKATGAEGEAHSLGSQTGVQSLLQQSQAMPENTAFDAALVNGQGAPGFQKLAQQYGGTQLEKQIVGANQNAQDRWSKLSGDVSARDAATPKGIDPSTTTAQTLAQGGTLSGGGSNSSYGPGDPVGAMNHGLDDLRTQNQDGYNAVLNLIGAGSWMSGNGTNAPGGAAAFVQGVEDGATDSLSKGYQQAAQAAEQQLGISWGQLGADLLKMTGNELGDFFAFGAVPPWMGGTGQPGGWNSPFADTMAANQADSGAGAWNAVTKQWGNGAGTIASAVPVVGGAVGNIIKTGGKG